MDVAADRIEQDIANAILKGRNVLLHSPGGCGKTYLARRIACIFAERGKIVACVAPTGIAAINLTIPEYCIAGRTMHSWGGIGMGNIPAKTMKERIKKNKNLCKRWRRVQLMIIDEISMVGKTLFEMFDEIARFVRDLDAPFGGIQVLLCGDFLQLPPVKDEWSFRSEVWRNLNLASFILEEPKRYNDLTWFSRLLRIRKGVPSDDDIAFLDSRFAEYKKLRESPSLSVRPTILHSKNIDVNGYNANELAKLPSQKITFRATDVFVPIKDSAIKDAYIKQLDDAIPELITLKAGAQVMLRANLDLEMGLANGSRGVILELDPFRAKVQWVNGTVTYVTEYTWLYQDKKGKATRTQIPLILAWASTIHKVQGVTVDSVICDLSSTIFLPGQAYVALSRVRNANGLYLSGFYPRSIFSDSVALKFVKSIECTEGGRLEGTNVILIFPKEP